MLLLRDSKFPSLFSCVIAHLSRRPSGISCGAHGATCAAELSLIKISMRLANRPGGFQYEMSMKKKRMGQAWPG